MPSREVIERDGTLAAEISLPDGLPPLSVRGDRLLGVRRDEFGVEQIVVHELVGS